MYHIPGMILVFLLFFLPVSSESGNIPDDYPDIQTSTKSLPGQLHTDVEWGIDFVDNPKTFHELTDRALRLDSAGHPHVMYGGDRLYYAWHDGLIWNYEIVDSTSGVGVYSSLALDSFDKASAAYIDFPTDSLKYAFQDGSGWQVEVVDSPVECHFISLDIDSSGFAHISYFTGLILKHAFQTDGGWEIETVDDGPFAKGYTSLAISEDDIIHISYLKLYYLYYAKKQDGIWQTIEVDPGPGSYGGYFSSIALDNEGHPHISHYRGQGGDTIQHSYWNQNTWITEEIEYVGGDSSYYNSIAIDDSGFAHIGYLYTEEEVSRLRHAYQDQTGWHIENVANIRAHFSIDVEPGGFAHFIYTDTSWLYLNYSFQDATGWHSSIIDESADVGKYSSLAIDSENFSQISYIDQTNGDLKFAYQDQSGWHTEVVDSDGDIRYSSTSLAIDSDGKPHVCYYDYSSEDLKYAVKQDRSWVIMTVDSNGDVGSNASLVLDSHNKARISYCDRTGMTLKVASGSFLGWEIEIVDSESTFNGNTCLALDNQGYPHISYSYDNPQTNDNDLRYAFKDSEGWHLEVIDTEGDCGIYNSMTIDNQEIVHVSYYEEGHGDLKYAKRNLEGWHLEVVQSIGGAGQFNSIISDNDNLPHIVYYYHYLKVLNHAYFSNGSWEFEIVDDRAHPGFFTSIVTDAENFIRISYGDGYSKDLKHAFQHIPQPTKVPTVTPTPTCPESGVALVMPSHEFHAGDECRLTAMICNRDPALWESHVFFCILAYAGAYWYGPDWTAEVTWEIIASIPPGLTERVVIEPFVWPADTGSASGLLFLSAITDPAMSEIIGSVGEWEFGWSE